MKKPILLNTYNGVKIHINENGWFEASIDGADLREVTFVDLKNKIDRTLKNKEKAKRKVLSIKVVNSELKTATVTGIHARLGTLTMTPKLECRRYGGVASVWLDCEPAKKLLTAKRAAEARIREIDKELQAFEIKVNHGYGEVKPDEYDRLLADLDKCVAVATKANEKAVKNGA